MVKYFLLLSMLTVSCTGPREAKPESATALPIIGTWKLLSGTLVEKGDTTVTDYTRKLSFIKIINDSHFSFIMHDLKGGKDSAAAFSAGAGAYTLKGNAYTEHLEYCNDRNWEGNDFSFQVSIHGDTLVQTGIEKVAATGVDRLNTERYVRMIR